MLKEKSMFALESNEKTDQPIPLSLYETKDLENLEVIDEGITCVDEAMEGTTIEFEKMSHLHSKIGNLKK